MLAMKRSLNVLSKSDIERKGVPIQGASVSGMPLRKLLSGPHRAGCRLYLASWSHRRSHSFAVTESLTPHASFSLIDRSFDQ